VDYRSNGQQMRDVSQKRSLITSMWMTQIYWFSRLLPLALAGADMQSLADITVTWWNVWRVLCTWAVSSLQ